MKRQLFLDSDVIIDFCRGYPSAVQLLNEAKKAYSVCTSSLAIIEVISGMREHERAQTYELLESLKIFNADQAISYRAGEIARSLRMRGLTIGVVDATHTAICLQNDLELITGNIRHYQHPQLNVVTYNR